jgi:predicted nucleotidyltransferase
MRDCSQLAARLSQATLQHCPHALAVALGGSQASGRHDDQSDLDLVVLLAEGALIDGARQVAEALLPLVTEPVQLVGGPAWKEGFGCRTSVLYADGFKLELFVVTPDTLPVVERVLRWQPLWGSRHLMPLQAAVARQLTNDRIATRAQFDVGYAHMSICRHLSRGELFAARHVLASLVAIAIALRLFQLGRAYDPVASVKRIVREGLDSDRVVREIEAASTLLGGNDLQLAAALHGLRRVCWAILRDLPERSKGVCTAQQHLEQIATAPERWMEASAGKVAAREYLSEPAALSVSEMNAAHHLLQGHRLG